MTEQETAHATTDERPWTEALQDVFDVALIELKPGATNRDKTKALALAYVDPREYQARLDAVVGVENWSVRYRVEGGSTFCALSIFGVVKEDVGESEGDKNDATIAVAQAFKRACTAFGLGRYLYFMPQIWCAYDPDKKRITDNQQAVAQEMYRRMGIL